MLVRLVFYHLSPREAIDSRATQSDLYVIKETLITMWGELACE
jgi:hypothetical protein